MNRALRNVAFSFWLLAMLATACSREKAPEESQTSGKETTRTPVPVLSEKAQHHIDRARFLQHCFEYLLSQDEYRLALREEPESAVAYCGMALNFYPPLHWPTDTNLFQLAAQAMQRARKAGKASPTEKSLVNAYAHLFEDVNGPHESRVREALAAMQASHERYPDDVEIASALALLHLATPEAPDSGDISRERMAANALFPLFEQNAQHVGLLHYLVLSLDGNIQDAHRGLPVAGHLVRLSDAVPATRRAPAGLFARAGQWPNALTAARAADASAKKLLLTMEWPPEMRDFSSALYLVYALVNSGRPEEARQLVNELRLTANRRRHPLVKSAAFQARNIFLLGGRRWAEAIKEQLDIGDDEERDMLAHTASVAGGFLKAPFLTGHGLEYFRKRLEVADPIRILEVDASLALIDGRVERVHEQMQKAISLEAQRGAGPVIPDPPMPARELYGEMLLKLDLPEQAAEQFERLLETRPHPMAMLGLARARIRMGQENTAVAPLVQALSSWAGAETNFTPVARAKEMLEQVQASGGATE